MSTHFNKIISYTVEKLSTKNFDFQRPIDDFLLKVPEEFFRNLEELKIFLEIRSPDFDIIENSYHEGTIKSHEIDAIINTLEDKVKNAIAKKINHLQHTINRYPSYKNKISLGHKEDFAPSERHHKRIDRITITFDTRNLKLKDIIVFLVLWSLEELSYAEQVNLKINIRSKGSKNYIRIINSNLEKKPLIELKDFLTLDDKDALIELYTHPVFQQILFIYVFPEGFNSYSEITLDILQEGIPPQKRRQILLKNGAKMRFHEAINKNMSNEIFAQIIVLNSISGVYVSVKSIHDEVLYLILDIDISDFIKSMFSRQSVWDLTLEISKVIIRTATNFDLPNPNVNFSGSRGCHIIWAIEKEAINDIEGIVNIPELYYQKIPGKSDLAKNKKSCIHDKFKFIKCIAQALCLHAVYNENIKIPLEIKKKLKIAHQYMLFKLSKESKNVIAILMDTSSIGRGVFRVYSAHPSTKLVSIPIYNPSTGKFYENYLDYRKLIEESQIEFVLNRFKENDIEPFLKRPAKITRKHIRELLRPNSLYPAFAILLRFDPRYSIKRSPKSFGFWHQFYTLRSFYDFIIHYTFNLENENIIPKNFISYIEHISKKLEIQYRKRVINLLKQYLCLRKISFRVLEDRLEAFYYMEFFFKLKDSIFIKKNKNELNELFNDEFEFNNFLNQADKIFSVVLETLIPIINSNDISRYSADQKKALYNFSQKTDDLINLARHYLQEFKYNPDMKRKKKRLIKTIHLISLLYFTMFDFLKNFFNLKQHDVEGD